MPNEHLPQYPDLDAHPSPGQLHRLNADRGSNAAEEDDHRVDEVADPRSRLDRIWDDEDKDENYDQQCRQPPRHSDRMTIAPPEGQTACRSCDRSESVLSVATRAGCAARVATERAHARSICTSSSVSRVHTASSRPSSCRPMCGSSIITQPQRQKSENQARQGDGQRIRARRGARAARSAATSPRRRSSSPRPSSSSTGPLGARCGPCSDWDIAAPRSTGQPGLPLIPRHGLIHNE